MIVEGSRLGAEDVGGLGEDQYGVQIMIHRSGPYSTPIHIEHTEVRYAGQAFRLGRYAIHFHLTGSMEGSYVRNCAIHHSNNRALTVHGVHDLLVEGNVAYDIKGHTFFVVRDIWSSPLYNTKSQLIRFTDVYIYVQMYFTTHCVILYTYMNVIWPS